MRSKKNVYKALDDGFFGIEKWLRALFPDELIGNRFGTWPKHNLFLPENNTHFLEKDAKSIYLFSFTL